MPCYLVRWEIDIDADSPREAAEMARAIQQNRDNGATYYEVTDPDRPRVDGLLEWETVNLDENEETPA